MKQLIFIGFWPDYEAYFIRALNLPDVDVALYNPMQAFNPVLLKLMPKPLRVAVFRWLIRRRIAQQPSATVVMHENRLALESLESYGRPVCAHILMRNIYEPVSKTGRCVERLRERGCHIWSFDDSDCASYGFRKYNQFVERNPSFEVPEATVDFGFIGRNKGRDVILNTLADIFKRQQCSYEFHIKEAKKRRWYEVWKPKNNNVSYQDYLHTLCSAHCIIDIVQTGQVGLTMRPIEAMLYQRKLLTNSRVTCDSEFYKPNNVLYIADATALEDCDVAAFLQTPFEPVEQEIQDKYSLRHLAQQIVALA